MAAFGLAAALSCAAGPGAAGGDDALRHINQGDCQRAGEEINRGLDAGEARAYFLAGYLYDITGCVAPDPERAARLYRRAVELGDVEARNFLGVMHGLGRGVPQDYRVAYQWFTYPIAGHERAPIDDDERSAMGYAYTITQLARAKVSYPTSSRSEGTVVVTFHTATGEVTFAPPGEVSAGAKALRPSTPFTRAIGDAYERSVREAPMTDEVALRDVVVATPWTFELR